jgi:hypothetical protein
VLRADFSARDRFARQNRKCNFEIATPEARQKASICMVMISKEEQPMMSESQEVAHGALNAARGMLHRFDPKPGDGATIAHLYDRDAGTVISVSVESNHVYVVVQEDAAVRTESSDLQTYAYTPNPEGRITTFRRKVSRPPTLRGAWKCCWRDPGSARWYHSNEPRVTFGYRRKYSSAG